MSVSLPCIICEKSLEDIDLEQEHNQPYGGTVFSSTGNYGSTVWDPTSPFSREFLELNICDDCLTNCADKGYVLHVDVNTKSEYKYETWGYKEGE